MTKVKLGMIGCGLCASTMHIPALKQLEDKFEIVNVVSRNKDKAKAFADTAGSAAFCTDTAELLSDKNVDAVVITYPFTMNYTVTKAALAAGKHVLIEKPMAPTLEEAEKMVDLAKATGLTTMIAENFRYRMAMMEAARFIREGAIGAPKNILYTCYGNMDRNSMWIVDSKWRLSSVGGVMLDRDVHYTAVLRMLMGEAKSAIGRWDRLKQDVGPMDLITLHILFDNGATGSLHDFASVTGLNRREIIVVGTEGTIILSEQCTRLNVVNEHDFTHEAKYPTDRADSVVREYEDFYGAITEHRPSRSTFLDGFRDLQLAMTPLTTNDKWDALELKKLTD